ncbi:MAG: flagellar basal body rod protein FlgC [Gemmataceae bacterium]
MGLDRIFGVTNICSSGLSAERARMEVVAQNIANAHTTRTPQGGPYRRQQIVFSALLEQQRGRGRTPAMGGVQVVNVIDDPSELPRIHQPGHPDADADGFVTMPNVQIPMEMVDLMTANRAYEANLKVLQAFKQQAEQTLSILRG